MAGGAAGARARVTPDPVALARELIAIPSPTGSEGAVGQHVAARLAAAGWSVRQQEVTPGRCNVYATRGTPVVVLSTHLDTVPPELPCSEDGEWLYGRGATDAKGIAAAQIAAAQRLAAAGEDRIGLLFVVGEEAQSDGAQAARALTPKGRYLVNGEPTENRLALGTKGSIRLRLRARGQTAHSAYPEEGRSAIEAMLDALQRIRALRFPADDTLGAVTLNIGTITGGVAPNVIPDACEAHLMYRTVSEHDPIIAATREAAGDGLDVEVALSMPPVRLAAREGFETTVVRYGTDLPWLEPWGERFLLGPGTIRVAHTDHERVRKADLHDAVERYERLARVLLAEATA